MRSSIAFILFYMITFTVTLFFTCQPFSSFWNQIWLYMLPNGGAEDGEGGFNCTGEGSSLLVNTGISILAVRLSTGPPTSESQ